MAEYMGLSEEMGTMALESRESLLFLKIPGGESQREILVRNGEVTLRLISMIMCCSLATVKTS